MIADKYADVEEEEEEFYGSEAGGDDDYGDEDEEGGDEEADYGDYGEEEESDEEEWPPKNLIQPAAQGNRFFREDETLREKYNDVELDNFMRLLGIKPKVQWQDQSSHHYKLGVH